MSQTTLIAADAPVTLSELSAACGFSRAAALKRATSGALGASLVPGEHIYSLAQFAWAEGRAAVERARAARAREVAEQLVRECPVGARFPIGESEFTESELEIGREWRELLTEIEHAKLGEPSRSYEELIDKVQARETQAAHRHDGSLQYKRLFVGGHKFASLITAKNFYRQKMWWGKWRVGVFDSANWQCLCPLYRWTRITEPDGSVRFVAKNKQRFGDATFWALFAQYYESAKQRSRQAAYELARDGALELGTRPEDIPTLAQVGYFYRSKIDQTMLERARLGEKHHYDKLSVSVIRKWTGVRPDMCWSGDHHLLNFFCRVPDVSRPGGWRAERPWLTDWIDVASWYTVGWHISIQPSRDTIELALQNGVRARQGVPKYLYCDNGKDYRAFDAGGRLGYDKDRVDSIAAALGVAPIYALPHNPRAKLNERNYRIMVRFEQMFTSFCGINAKHMTALWDVIQEDGYTLRDRLERFPKNHELAGCLVRPELVPTLEEVRAAFVKWLGERRHEMVSQGRVCPGQSPSQRYLRHGEAAPLLRAVSGAEIGLAFLRVHRQPLLVKRNGSIEWTPPGGRAADKLVYADAVLRRLAGARVQVRFDLINFDPPRLFVFEPWEHADRAEKRESWKLVQCSGPEGSVPNLDYVDAVAEDQDAAQATRDRIAETKRLSKANKPVRSVVARDQANAQLRRDLGLSAAPEVFEIKPRERRLRVEPDAQGRSVRAALRDEISDEDRRQYLEGVRPEAEPAGQEAGA